MRHGNKFNHLSRDVDHRKALLKNLANALIEHKRISTTLAKAKALRLYLEPIITKCKTNTTHSRRIVFGYLQQKEVVKELFGPVAEKVATRPGGYLRIIKTGFRRGDGAETAMIEFVDFNELYLPKTAADTTTRKRTRRGGKKKYENKVAEAPVAAPANVISTAPEDAPAVLAADDTAPATPDTPTAASSEDNKEVNA